MRAITAFEQGAKFVIMDAPTGAGKTLIGDIIRRLLNVRALYTCTTKQLQDQAEKDFPYSVVLKGRSNYPTLDFPEKFRGWEKLSAGDCTKERGGACDRCEADLGDMPIEQAWHCLFCHPVNECPYEQQKMRALAAPLAVTNTAYFLSEANYVGRFSDIPFVTIDEADSLESILMGFVEVVISPRRCKDLGISPPSRRTAEAAAKSGAWRTWVEDEALPKVAARIARLKRTPKSDIRASRELKSLKALGEALLGLAEGVEDGNWVYDPKAGGVAFRPVRVDQFGEAVLWRHAQKFLLMSGTIISAEEMANSLGIPAGQWASVNVPSTFPKENRPIYVCPVANMRHQDKETEWPKLAKSLRTILALHPKERILGHTVSYALAEYLKEELNSPRIITYTDAGGRDQALRAYLSSPDAVLLAPSFERGVDLPMDKCSVIVVCKVPFGDLSSKQVSARLWSKGGNNWYTVQAIRSLVQMTGRGVRSETDTCTTYLVDKQFVTNILRRGKYLLPEWWREALVTTNAPNLH